jgi:hypothetical protein
MQLDGLSQRFSATAGTVADTWTAALQHQARGSEQLVGGLDRALATFTSSFEQRSAALLSSVHEAVSRVAIGAGPGRTGEAGRLDAGAGGHGDHGRIQHHAAAGAVRGIAPLAHRSEAGWTRQQGERMVQLATLCVPNSLRCAPRTRRARPGRVERLGELQAALASHLATLGAALEAPVDRLLQTAAKCRRPQPGDHAAARGNEPSCRARQRSRCRSAPPWWRASARCCRRAGHGRTARGDRIAGGPPPPRAGPGRAPVLGNAGRAERPGRGRGRAGGRQRGRAVQPGRGLPPRRAAVQRQQREADGRPAAHRGRHRPVHDAQRRAAGLLRGPGARGDRPEHQLAAGHRRGPAPAARQQPARWPGSPRDGRTWTTATTASSRPRRSGPCSAT